MTIEAVRQAPFHHEKTEYELVEDWQKRQDPKAVERLLKNHERLIIKIARGYAGYGLPLSDLIAEGHVGMLYALRNFDPKRGLKLSTYAVFWIKSTMLDFILRMASIVRIARTKSQKKLFFNLRRQQFDIQKHLNENMSDESIEKIAKKLNVSKEDVADMHGRLRSDLSLNSKRENGESEWQEWVQDDDNHEHSFWKNYEMKARKKILAQAMATLSDNERDILSRRRLSDNVVTLKEIALEKGLSQERIRQIEEAAFKKLRGKVSELSAAL